MSVLIRCSTFGTSVYTPALADIMADFNISRTAALIGITVYTLGLGVRIYSTVQH